MSPRRAQMVLLLPCRTKFRTCRVLYYTIYIDTLELGTSQSNQPNQATAPFPLRRQRILWETVALASVLAIRRRRHCRDSRGKFHSVISLKAPLRRKNNDCRSFFSELLYRTTGLGSRLHESVWFLHFSCPHGGERQYYLLLFTQP